jgi:hypothetical protein
MYIGTIDEMVHENAIRVLKLDRELKLYTHPDVLNNQTTQKPLSDEEITKMANIWGNGYQPVIIDFARAIEKSHGIGE